MMAPPERRTGRRLLRLTFGDLFWRTFLLIALLIAVSLAAWFQSFRVIETGPRAQRVALQLVAIVKLTRTALLYSDATLRHALLQELENNEGVRVYPRDKNDQYLPQTDDSLNQLIEHDVRGRLGKDTLIARSVNGTPGVWISTHIGGYDYWVALDRNQLDNTSGLQWASWGMFALALSLCGALFISNLVNRPFAQLAAAARRVGSGQVPRPLPEHGLGIAVEANRSFNRMVSDLEQIDTDRALMLAGISHDLRTPLARLRLATEMTPASQEDKDAMTDDIEQMDRIIGRFLDYAKPVQRPAGRVDLSAIVAELAVRMADEEQVRVTAQLAPTAIISADDIDMRRMVSNLIENARKYGASQHDGIAHIAVSTHQTATRVELSIADAGPGVPEDKLPLITRPFYRVDAARTQASGTGLGMAIVQRLVARYQGTLRLANRTPGPGLEVTITFPLAGN
jgi:two-component system osmolarity sensor histidine kinase EnvZ